VICLKIEEKPKFKLTVKGRKVSKGRANVKRGERLADEQGEKGKR
jgi:hypothetical protein